MEISNEELFNSALNDEPVVQEETQEQQTEQESAGLHRDEQGRFAAKPEQAEQETNHVTQEAKPEPESVGLRQVREALERSQRRQSELERELLSLRPRPEAPKKPDIFENPDGFVKQTADEAITPIRSEINGIKEQFSLMYALDKFGEEKVNQAYAALDDAAKRGDPDAVATANRVKQSMTPYQDIVKWHERQSVISEVGNDPNAFFQKKLDEALKDDKFKSELLSKLQPREEKPRPVFNVPPSLNRVAAAQASLEESGDLSNESLFANALR